MTSGITVIRMALMKSVPNGSITVAAFISIADPDIEAATPSAMPPTNAMSTLVVSDTRRSYSPCLDDARRSPPAINCATPRASPPYELFTSTLSAMSFKTYADLVAEAKRHIAEVSPREAMQLQTQPNTVFVDCREPNEFNLGSVPGAHLIPRGILEQNIESVASRDQKVILYCASGNRSALAAVTLREMGYTDVASLRLGFRGWVEAGGEVDG
jgi:rhodanese-related sulfurtransferase